MIIVGLTGGIGHGKTSFASFLAACAPHHSDWESSAVICEVANGLRNIAIVPPEAENISAINDWLMLLPDILMATVHVDPSFEAIALTPERLQQFPENYIKLFEYLDLMRANPQLHGEEITIDNKSQYRSLLQWLGGYLVRMVDEGIWYNEIIRRIRLAQAGGSQLATVGGLRFPGDAERLRNANGSIIELRRDTQSDLDTQDITERERRLIVADTIVINDGNLEQLANCAQQVYADLELHQLRPKYIATTS